MASSSHQSAAFLIAVLIWPALAGALDPQPPVVASVRWDTGEPTWGLCSARPYFGPGSSRYLSFACFGDDLTPDDSNDRRDTVLLDRATNLIELISVTSAGQQIPFDSFSGRPSADGQQVAFPSTGPLHPDYGPPPTSEPGRHAIYLHHRGTGQTDLISRDAFGQALTSEPAFYGANFERNEILFHYSGDIRTGPSPGPFGSSTQLWVKNWVTGAVEAISVTPSGELTTTGAASGSFSATGRYVVFIGGNDLGSPARPGDFNIYLRDRLSGNTERLTWPWTGAEFQGERLNVWHPRVSADGRFVVFSTSNTEIHADAATAGGTHVYLLDRQTGLLEHVSPTPGYPSYNFHADISDDGRYVAWHSRNFSFDGPADPPADMRAIWVLDRQTGERVSVTAPLGPLRLDNAIQLDLAPDGSAIAFIWRVADPASPLFARPLMYTVDLRGEPPPPPPPAVPVPTSSPWLLLLLAGGMLLVVRAHRASFKS